MTSDLRIKAVKLFVTCGGLGLLPKGPGTWTSAVACLFWWILLICQVSQLLIVSAILILFITGVWLSRLYEQNTNSHDASEITIDEWVGMGVSMLVIDGRWALAVAAFVLFRIFDISKPMGIRYFDRNYLEGWGVMMDDVIAGVYTCVLIGLYRWLEPMIFQG